MDAEEQHAENEVLRARLAQAEKDRDAWWAEAERAWRTGRTSGTLGNVGYPTVFPTLSIERDKTCPSSKWSVHFNGG